jgi:hypothetical protein
VSGDQKVDELIADVRDVEVGVQHEIQQVARVLRASGGPIGSPGRDDVVGDSRHVRAMTAHPSFDQPGQELRQVARP